MSADPTIQTAFWGRVAATAGRGGAVNDRAYRAGGGAVGDRADRRFAGKRR